MSRNLTGKESQKLHLPWVGEKKAQSMESCFGEILCFQDGRRYEGPRRSKRQLPSGPKKTWTSWLSFWLREFPASLFPFSRLHCFQIPIKGKTAVKPAFVYSISLPCLMPFSNQIQTYPIWNKDLGKGTAQSVQGSQQNNPCCSWEANEGHLQARASWTTRFQASSRTQSFSSHTRDFF